VQVLNPVRDWLFNRVHSNNLVYNTCWEDPRCDRELMQFEAGSKIVMITSAGCNALDYLLDGPASIDCIDMNHRQNALLELKKACFRVLGYKDFFMIFGKGRHRHFKSLYLKKIRPELPAFAAAYWDKNLRFFNGRGLRKSFYHFGTSGTFAWLAKQYFASKPGLKAKVDQLLGATDLATQQQIYREIEPSLLHPIIEWAVNRHLTMCLVGVPRSQQQLFVTKYERGALGFIQQSLEKVFTKLPTSDNYFWRVYLDGAYTESCCPNYLMAHNFDTLRARSERIHTHTTTVSQFLKNNPGAYTHFILLDHQDWLAENDLEALEEEWQLILQNSVPGTRILLRSAAETVDFFPNFVKTKVRFESSNDVLADSHQRDRVGTYASVYLGTVL
jgi:S-adenosylmethionine-diacylglycerol 3-amino-3-carboxypropyl transferase